MSNKILFGLMASATFLLSACGDDASSATKADEPEKEAKEEAQGKDEPKNSKCPDFDESTHFCDERDGIVYKYVTIGDQIWMAENLNHKVENSFCNVDSCTKYGRMYTWGAAMDSAGTYSTNSKGCGFTEDEDDVCSIKKPARGVCPEGWHIPDSTEFAILVDNVGGQEVAGKKLKSTTGWTDYDGNAVNGEDAYGFTALSVMTRLPDGVIFGPGVARFWSTEYYGGFSAYYLYLTEDDGSAWMEDPMENNFSVRCIKD